MKPRGMADSPLFRNEETTGKSTKNISDQSFHHATIQSFHLDSFVPSIAQTIKEVGKEACTFRLTHREKTTLIEIIYHFRIKNIKVTENDIARIAINYITADFKHEKNKSILARVLDSMTP